MSSLIFSLPLWPSNQPSSYRAEFYKPAKKRKREDLDDSVESVENSSQSIDHAPAAEGDNSQQLQSSIGQISLNDAHQYRYAGLSALDDLPGRAFPHRPIPPDNEVNTQKKLQRELASLNPSLLTSNAHLKAIQGLAQPLAMRYHHIAVITTILHRCMLEGDFERAGRAWAMILRAGVRGKGVDMRGDGRWGIGAEILLHRGEISPSQIQTGPGDDDEQPSSAQASEAHLTGAAFEQAREYYERMILQFPYNRLRPHATDSLDFYPAMFSVWIYGVQDKYKRKRSQLQSAAKTDSNSDSGSSSESDSSISLDGHSSFQLYRAHNRAKRRQHKESSMELIRNAELAEAEAIAARMDEILVSPPYGDSQRLWNLRGMLSLYLGDICLTPEPPAYNDESSGERQHQDGDERLNVLLARSNHAKSLARREKELNKARAAFGRVLQRGGKVWAGVSGMLEKEQRPEMETDDE